MFQTVQNANDIPIAILLGGGYEVIIQLAIISMLQLITDVMCVVVY